MLYARQHILHSIVEKHRNCKNCFGQSHQLQGFWKSGRKHKIIGYHNFEKIGGKIISACDFRKFFYFTKFYCHICVNQVVTAVT